MQQNQSLIKGLQKGIRERARKRLFKGEVIKARRIRFQNIPDHVVSLDGWPWLAMLPVM